MTLGSARRCERRARVPRLPATSIEGEQSSAGKGGITLGRTRHSREVAPKAQPIQTR